MKTLIVILSGVLGAELMAVNYMLPALEVSTNGDKLPAFVFSLFISAVFGGFAGAVILGTPLYSVARWSEKRSPNAG